MTHDARWYRERLQELEKQLTPSDRQWFDELREYTLLGALIRDETAVTAQLYAMMTDLLAAEQDGDDAAALFGDAPQALADDLLKQLPTTSGWDAAKLVGIVVGVSWLLMLISGGLTATVLTIASLTYLAVAVWTSAMVVAIFTALRWQVYATAKLLRHRVGSFLVLWAIMFVFIGGIYAIITLLPPVLTITVPFPWSLLVIGAAVGIACWLTLRQHEPLFTPMAFMIVVIGGLTMLRLTWHATHFWPQWVIAAITVVVALVAGLLYVLWMRRAAKRSKD